MKYPPLLLFLVLFILSCKPQLPKALSQAASVIESHPDSALHLIRQAQKECKSYSASQRMHLLLLYAEAMNKAMLPMDTLRFDEIYHYYMSHGSANEKMKACYLMGSIFRDRHDAPQALQYYQQATTEARTSDTDCNYKELSRIYGQMAEIYQQQRYPQNVIRAARRGMTYALRADDSLTYIDLMAQIGGAYRQLENMDSAYHYFDSCYQAYKASGYRKEAAAIQICKVDYHLQNRQYAQAKTGIDEYMQHSKLIDERGNPIAPPFALIYYYLGEYYQAVTQLDSAQICYYKVLAHPTLIQNVENGASGLMKLYAQLHQPDSTAKYAHIYAATNDSANRIHSAQEIIRMERLYDYTAAQQQVITKSDKIAALWKVLFLTVIVCLTFLGSLVWLTRMIRRRTRIHQQAMQAQQAKYERTVAEIEETAATLQIDYLRILQNCRQAEAELLRLREQTNVDRQQQEALVQVKEKEISELRKSLTTYEAHFNVAEWSQKSPLASHTFIAMLHQLAQEGRAVNTQDINDLTQVIKNCLPDFYTKIEAFADCLTSQELFVLFLTRLDFSPFEITNLLGLSKQRISNIRRDLNLKLFGEKGTRSLNSHVFKL